MIDQNKFNDLEELLDDKNILFARRELALLRKNLDLDPDYLYLMSRLLLLDNRFYLSIDAIILSLYINTRDDYLNKRNFIKSTEKTNKKKRLLLSELAKLIANEELEKNVYNIQDDKVLTEHLFNLMPGLRPKKI